MEHRVHARAATPEALIERIVDAATLASPEKAGWIRIQLSPADLGDLLIELTLRGSALYGRVLTENEAAKDLIMAHLARLRERLEGQGIQVGEFKVTVDRSLRPSMDAGLPHGGLRRSLERTSDPGNRLRSVRPQVLDVSA